MSDESEFEQTVMGICDKIGELREQALAEYTPIVETLLHTGSRDVSHIERTLDGLLDFCGDESVLQLYRQLCRHYFAIDPAAAAAYVNAYREMYDAESDILR